LDYKDILIDVLAKQNQLLDEVNKLKTKVTHLETSLSMQSTKTIQAVTENKEVQSVPVRNNPVQKDSIRVKSLEAFRSIIKETGLSVDLKPIPRNEGGGNNLRLSENEVVPFSFNVSKNYYSPQRISVRGWHTIKEEDIESKFLHIFCIYDSETNKAYFLEFSREDLLNNYVSQKKPDAKGNYHFYFEIALDYSFVFDIRDNLYQEAKDNLFALDDILKEYWLENYAKEDQEMVFDYNDKFKQACLNYNAQ